MLLEYKREHMQAGQEGAVGFAEAGAAQPCLDDLHISLQLVLHTLVMTQIYLDRANTCAEVNNNQN